MDIYAVAIVISLVIYVAVGNYAGRRIKHLDDYFVAGRNAPTILIVGTLVASLMSTNAFLGEPGFVYNTGAGPYLLWPGIAATFYVYGALFFGRYLRRSRALTVAEYFGKRFASRRVQQAAGITIILGLTGYLMAVTQGAAYLLTQVVDIPFPAALLVSWVCYTGFTLYAGTKGVILTDTLMFLLFTSAAFLAMLFLLNDAGGMATAVSKLSQLPDKPGLMSWAGVVGENSRFKSGLEFAAWNISIALAWGMVYAVSPWQSSRYLIARDEHTVLRAAIIAAVCLTFLEITIYLGSVVVNLSDPGITPDHQVMIYAAKELMPPVLGAVVLAGVMAAALSSATTFQSLVGFSLSNDLLPDRSLDEKTMLRVTRWTMLAVSIVALVVAFSLPVDLFWTIYFVGTLYAASWGPVAIMSVWSRRITASAAFWGILSGFTGYAVSYLLEDRGLITLPWWLEPVLFGTLVSLVTILVVSRFGQVSRAEQVYRMKMHRTPEIERDPEKTRTTARMPLIMVIYSLAIAGIWTVYYIRPYQEATGTSAWREMTLLYVGPVLWCGTALFAWWMIRRSYR